MKRKVLVIFLCLFVIAGAGGIWGYQYFFGVDHNLRSQLQEEFSEDFFTFQPIIEASGEVEVEGANPSQPIVEGKSSEENIRNRYIGKLESLEDATIQKVEVLFEKAYQEYKQQNLDNQLSETQLARKYLQAANMLEEAVEDAFQEVIREMKIDLQENQLSDDLVRELESTYQNRINETKSAIMQQLN